MSCVLTSLVLTWTSEWPMVLVEFRSGGHGSWASSTASDHLREHDCSLIPRWGSDSRSCALCLSTLCHLSSWQYSDFCGLCTQFLGAENIPVHPTNTLMIFWEFWTVGYVSMLLSLGTSVKSAQLLWRNETTFYKLQPIISFNLIWVSLQDDSTGAPSWPHATWNFNLSSSVCGTKQAGTTSKPRWRGGWECVYYPKVDKSNGSRPKQLSFIKNPASGNLTRMAC